MNNMKKLLSIITLLLIVIGLTGCTMKYPELDENAIAFTVSSYVDEEHDNASYLTIEYNGRTYLPYGTQKGILQSKDLDKCIGYIVQDENSSSIVDPDNKDTRIYTLTEDKDNNFLMEYYIGTNEMNDPIFYRAMDTKGKDITIPKIIDGPNDNYWKS